MIFDLFRIGTLYDGHAGKNRACFADQTFIVRRLFSSDAVSNVGADVFDPDQADHSEYRYYIGSRRFSRGFYSLRGRQVDQRAGILSRDGSVETGKRF